MMHDWPTTDLHTALSEAIGRLRQARVPSPILAAELLLMHLLGRDRAWLYAHPEAALDGDTADRYFDLVARRIKIGRASCRERV